jgi:hypothetical protein
VNNINIANPTPASGYEYEGKVLEDMTKKELIAALIRMHELTSLQYTGARPLQTR